MRTIARLWARAVSWTSAVPRSRQCRQDNAAWADKRHLHAFPPQPQNCPDGRTECCYHRASSSKSTNTFIYPNHLLLPQCWLYWPLYCTCGPFIRLTPITYTFTPLHMHLTPYIPPLESYHIHLTPIYAPPGVISFVLDNDHTGIQQQWIKMFENISNYMDHDSLLL